MRKIVINGGRSLAGKVTVSGAKNSVVALIPAIILADGIVTLDGVPAISDVDSLIDIMETMGAKVRRTGDSLEIDPRGVKDMPMPFGKINSLRASYYFYGSLLGRYGQAIVGLPGGCDLGPRPIDLHIKAFETRDEQEVAGYATVMNTIFESWENIPFDENHIKQFHRDLLQFSDKDQRHRGEYKKLDNHVEAFDEDGNSVGIVFQTDSPFDTPRLMEELTQWTIRSIDEKRHHPLIIAAVFIVSFLAIHPFQDGNGRLSRVLTTLLLLKAGYLYVPYSSLESLIEKNKEGYYLALRRTQGAIRTDQVNWQPWLLFFLEVLLKQKRKLETKVEKEKLMQKSLPELSLQILSLTKEHGSIAVSDVVAATDANRNTVKKHLQNLVASGYLLQQGARKAARYVLH